MSDEQEKYDRAFISYIDDDGNTKDGVFDDVVTGPNTVSFRTSKNRIILPWSRVLKVKAEEAEK